MSPRRSAITTPEMPGARTAGLGGADPAFADVAVPRTLGWPDAALTLPQSSGPGRPARSRGGLAVVQASPGATVTARIAVPARALAARDSAARRWNPGGTHPLRVGRPAGDLRVDLPIGPPAGTHQ